MFGYYCQTQVLRKCEKKCAQKRIAQYASRNENNREFPKIESLGKATYL